MEDSFESAEETRADLEACELHWQEILRADPAYIDWLQSLETQDEQ